MNNKYINLQKKRDYPGILAFICIIILAFYIYYSYLGCFKFSPQSLRNLRFATEHESLLAALKSYTKVRVPLYPVILWTLVKSGFPAEIVNFLFFIVILFLIKQIFSLYVKNIHWAWPVLLYSLSSFNFVNMKQYTAETLFVAVSFLAVVSLFKYSKNANMLNLIILSLYSCFFYLTRYFAIFLFLPLAFFNILITNILDIKKAVKHIVSYLLVSLAPVLAWMFSAYRETGYISGMDRFGLRKFKSSPELFAWNGINTFPHNIYSTLKTIFVDFFSPDSFASHRTVESPYTLRYVEYIAVILFSYIVVSQVKNILAILKDKSKDHPYSLVLQYAAMYILMTVVIWNFGNNDPIYTRFLYPVYPYLLLSVFLCYSYIMKNGFSSLYQRLPFILLYLLYIIINCYKNIVIVHSCKNVYGA